MKANTKNIPALRFPKFQDNWEKRILSEVTTKITDGTHDTPKVLKNGVAFITAIHVKNGAIDFSNCYYVSEEDHEVIYKRCNPQKDDLLIVNIGAGTGACALVNVDYQFSMKNVALVKPDKKILNPKYLAQYQGKQTSKLFHQLTSGGAQPFLSLKQIGKLRIEFPSLPEQQKIADFLTAVDERIQQLAKKKQLLEQYKKGVMQQLFSQQLRFKDKNGNKYPDWEEKKLGEITIPIKRKSDKSDYKVLTISAGKGFLTQEDRFSQIIAGESLKKYTLLFKNEFAYNRGGSKTYKFGCIYCLKDYGAALVPNVYRSFSLLEGDVSFFEHLFQFDYLNNQLKQIISSSVRLDGLLNISEKDFYNCKLIFPCLEEQRKISDFLNGLDNRIDLLDKQLKKTQAFKKGLLQQMFV